MFCDKSNLAVAIFTTQIAKHVKIPLRAALHSRIDDAMTIHKAAEPYVFLICNSKESSNIAQNVCIRPIAVVKAWRVNQVNPHIWLVHEGVGFNLSSLCEI
jgi:hypothetical protein